MKPPPPNMRPFIDLAAQQAQIRPQIEAAITRVLDHGQYIMGAEVDTLEDALADFTGARHAITTSSGTDALMLCLMALGVKAGDAVIVPSFSFAASAEVLPCLGAVPIFAEVDAAHFTLDPARLDDALTAGQAAGLTVVGIIPVGLFGQPADMARINAFAEKHGLWVIDDAAQSLGSTRDGKRGRTNGGNDRHQFFPRQTPWLLWRWRGDFYR